MSPVPHKVPPTRLPPPPLTVDTFFPQYVRFFKVLDWVNLVSLVFVVVYCILWMGVLFRCPKLRLRSRYVMGTAVALVFWHIPGLITLIATPSKVLCSNAITRATEQNQLCAVQGPSPPMARKLTMRISVCVFYSCCGIPPGRLLVDCRCCGGDFGLHMCIFKCDGRVFSISNMTWS